MPETGAGTGIPETGAGTGIPETGAGTGIPETGAGTGMPEIGAGTGHAAAGTGAWVTGTVSIVVAGPYPAYLPIVTRASARFRPDKRSSPLDAALE